MTLDALPSREQHRDRQVRAQGAGCRLHPAKVPGKGPGDQGRRRENDQQQIYQKIWEPGLSTAEKVTEVSGGEWEWTSSNRRSRSSAGPPISTARPGKGTTITIKLPLTLAILPSRWSRSAGRLRDSDGGRGRNRQRRPDQLSSVQGRQMASVRGRVVSLLRLGDLLCFHGPGTPRRPSLRRPPW